MTEHKRTFKHKLSIMAIAKNEGSYFREWIEYHRLVGVEKFYIYDNESTDDTREVLKPYIKSGLVEYKYWPGQAQQLAVYNYGIKKHKNETKWLAIIDLDEFLVPMHDKTITKYLDKLPKDVSAVKAGWVMYGSNGHARRPAGLVIENFKMRASSAATKRLPGAPFKSIINPRYALGGGAHGSVMFGGRGVGEYGKRIDDFAIRCNHYHCKSWEEYQKRAPRGSSRGGAAPGLRKYTREFFDANDHNDVLDKTMDKFIEPLKKRMKQK